MYKPLKLMNYKVKVK